MRIIAELKAGIDPTTSNLINGDINAHWLLDESNILCMTKYDGTLSGDFWNPIGSILSLDDTGTASTYWTLEAGNILQLGA